MAKLFTSSKKGIIGMELSSSQLRMVELSGTPQRLVVEHFAVQDIPTDMYINHDVIEDTKLGKLIQSALERNGFRTKDVALALPSARVIVKEFPMPDGLNESGQVEVAAREVSENVPLPLEDVYMDFKVLGAHPNQDNALLAAYAVSKKEHVDERLAAMEAAKLMTRVVDSDHNALLFATTETIDNQLPEMLDLSAEELNDQPVLLIHATNERTEYLFYRHQKLIWSREHYTCAKTLWENLSHTYGISVEEARDLSQHPERFHDRFARAEADVLLPFIDQWALDIRQHLTMFSEETSTFGIKAILISGEIGQVRSTSASIDELVQERVEIPTVIMNPMAHCQLAPALKNNTTKLLEAAPLLAVAMGMALRSFE